jgi:myo-inositol 2-dehydrogenase / D-chiro-inositol 1-dehydrogenase
LLADRAAGRLVEGPARELAARYGSASGSDVDVVSADPAVDAIVIASPAPTHVYLLARAVAAGKAVLCESLRTGRSVRIVGS